MKHRFWILFPFLLLLVLIIGCGQSTAELGQVETVPETSSTAQSVLPTPDPSPEADGPADTITPDVPEADNDALTGAEDILEPPPVAPSASTSTAGESVEGAWTLGMLSGGQYNAETGKYEGGATGMGQIYTFKPDGTYTALVIFGNTIWLTGKYSIADDVLTLTGRTAQESGDDGNTWSAPETLPDASSHFVVGTDEAGAYLLFGEEGATPPLEEKKNAMKYKLTE